MAIRTLEELEATLTADLKWRVQEMFVFEKMAEKAREHELSALMRAGLALVYAHWEGYVKTAGSGYLEYISRKRLKLGQLRPEVAAVALRNVITTLSQQKSSESHTDLVRTLWDRADETIAVPYETTTIRTNANLKFELFASIMHSLGCDASRHRAHEMLIDERLLGWRNEIAHGRGQLVTLTDWIVMRDVVEVILRDVRTQVSNAAAMNTFMRQQ
ncbi:hypothetical protein MANY_38250 [Mycolicibacterium anyangense]|uniref:MAE-28990/MAE-18760-like HEPN domain-containing protein n=1 Tax=Mycolicibacterium anyangense TaxID=1431246 RepID=A0A6N4WDA2_9MYCO|nr:MAE_28990/MAE_18760 family HEPN-like nuclease [Mycolicibacterium anyangense]BBZ78488.1 hypothetical protein MANY_38250 [Mycolicibacterium anyangense]